MRAIVAAIIGMLMITPLVAAQELDEVNTDVENAVATGADATVVADTINERTYMHLTVLKRVRERVNERARARIDAVIERALAKQADIVQRFDAAEKVEVTIT